MAEVDLVYLDHAATSPLRPEVGDAMADVRAELLGNPTGSHRASRRARLLLDTARSDVAELVGSEPGQIIITSGGTESANLAVFGALGVSAQRLSSEARQKVLCLAIEHASVLEPCRAATGQLRDQPKGPGPPRSLSLIPVDSNGLIDLEAMDGLLDTSVALVAVQLANNEVGTVQPVAEVVERVRTLSPHAVVVADAVQAAPYLDLGHHADTADFVVLSAHKLGGPVGTGALISRTKGGLQPQLYGGGQERDRRSGTQDVVGAVGLARALRLAVDEQVSATKRVGALSEQLMDGLLAAVPHSVRTVNRATSTLPGHCHLRVSGIEQEELLVALDDEGVCASAGASCASGALEQSHVLAAMGLDRAQAGSSIRFSLGWSTGEADVNRAITATARAVARLRS
jgi:cysteine desulfurase